MNEDTNPEVAEDSEPEEGKSAGMVAAASDRDDKGRFTPEPEAPKPVAKPAPVSEAPKPVAVAADAVTVSVAALAYSERKRNSLSVAVLQDRLAEVGQKGVKADLKGWFHDSTRDALKAWQSDKGREPTGVCTADDAKALFAGTKVVVKD